MQMKNSDFRQSFLFSSAFSLADFEQFKLRQQIL